MATCNSADSILEAAALIKTNGKKIDKFTNGSITDTVQLGDGEPTPSLRKFLQDIHAAIDGGVLISEYAFAGHPKVYYIDGTNGSDSNEGTLAAPWKTLERGMAEYNKGLDTCIDIKLLGDNVYTVPTSIHVIAHNSPHISSYNGSPTVKFLYNGSDTPHAYSGHWNLHGTAEHRLNFECVKDDFYFEGCSCVFEYVNFKQPTAIIGGNLITKGCSFTTRTGKATKFGPGARPALYTETANARIHDATFASTDGLSTGLLALAGVVHLYDGVNAVEQASAGTKPLLDLQGCKATITCTPNLGTLTNSYSVYVSLTNTVASISTVNTLTYMQNYGYSATRSAIFSDGRLMKNSGLLATPMTNNKEVHIASGDQPTDGGGIWLYGKNYPTAADAGKVRIQAYNGTYYYHEINADGTDKTNAQLYVFRSNAQECSPGIRLEGAGQNFALSAVDTSFKKGTPPASSNKYWGIDFYGEDHEYYTQRVGLLETVVTPENRCSTSLIAYGCTTNLDENHCSIRAIVDGSGNAYTEAPTPSAGDNSTKIATTEYVQGEISSFASDPNTVSGAKTFNQDCLILKSSSGHSSIKTTGDGVPLRIWGGQSDAKSPKLLLIPSDFNTSDSGSIQLTTSNGTGSNNIALKGKPDGTLTWNGQTIQTSSDERLKTQLSTVPDDVLDAWEDVDWGQFQFLDAINRKGEAARFHLGLIAQRVKAIFEARGLDACQYGILCYEEEDDLWTVRYTEALAMEAACLRRRLARLEAKVG